MGAVFWRAITFAVENETVGVVSEPVDGGGAEESVRKHISPLAEIKIAGDKQAARSVTFGNQKVPMARAVCKPLSSCVLIVNKNRISLAHGAVAEPLEGRQET